MNPGRPAPSTAARDLATAAVPIADPHERVEAVRERLLRGTYESAADVAVCDGARLVGLVPVERIFAAEADVTVASIMDSDPPVAEPGLDQEKATWKAVRHGESSLAVVDEEGRFIGLIPPSRMLGVLLAEHDEDLARLGGFLHDSEAARAASWEPVRRRLWHRLPWLLVGLAGAVAASQVVSAYEEELGREVMLAFFIPGIVYMADAVGTQTETLVIRGLSVGVPIGGVLRRELLTGLGVGTAIAAAFMPISMLLWDRPDVSLAVSLSLLASCCTATVVAMALPWGFHRLGRDPAYGSGPLATVVQDLLSLLIYFWIAVALLN